MPIRRTAVVSFLLVFACAAGCQPAAGPDPSDAGDGGPEGGLPPSSDGGGDANDDTASIGCVVNVSGATTYSEACSVSATYSSADNGVDFLVTTPSHAFFFGGTIVGKTTFTAGTYTLSDAPEAGALYIPTGAPTSEWAMCNNNACSDGLGNDVPNQGTFTMTITDAGPLTGGLLWQAPQGSATVTLPADPNTGATGVATATVTF